MLVVGFDTATDDTAVCAWEDGEVVDETVIGPGPPGDQAGPRHRPAPGDRAGGRGGRGMVGCGTDRRRHRPGLVHRPANRDRHRAGARGGAGEASGRGRDPRRAGPRHAGGRGRRSGAAGGARRAARAAVRRPLRRRRLCSRGAVPGGPRTSSRISYRGSRGRRWRRGSGALRFRRELSGSGAEIPGEVRSRSSNRRPAHLCSGCGRCRGRGARTEISETTRRGTLA